MKSKMLCAWRGCRCPAVFEWALCAAGRFWLCVSHDIEMNRVLATTLGRRDVCRVMRRYETNEHRLRRVRMNQRDTKAQENA